MRRPTRSRPASEGGREAGIQLRRRLAAFLLPVILLTGGCARLPDYALPQIHDYGDRLPSQVITYRPLSIADFRAPLPPARLQGRASRVNAHGAVAIRAVVGARYASLPSGNQGTRLYCGRIENLRFEAVMLPEESWWRPDLEEDKEAYVLQHEQIHFALMEVAARQLTRRSATEPGSFICNAELDETKKKLTAVVKGWLDESREEVLRKHTRFDEDTSGRFVPEAQQRWYDRMSAALQELEAWD